MNQESNRLKTFQTWPAAAEVDKARIAQCGFFYLGRNVDVQCFACAGMISQWNFGDQVIARHRELNPRCPFVLNPAGSGNIPITQPESSAADRNAETVGRDDIYKNDALRLLSYVHWPGPYPPREEMVLAGFYHVSGGKVRCAWCGVEIHRNWTTNDDPLAEHRRLHPGCPFLQQRDLTPPASQAPPIDNSEPPQNITPLNNRDLARLNSNVLEAQEVWESLGVVPISNSRSGNGNPMPGPRNPGHASIVNRLETFREWPSESPLSPTELANAGFFFTGVDDQVRCFYCDGGLGMWEPGDSPWSEHKRWFPRCPFLNLARPDPVLTRGSNQLNSSNGEIHSYGRPASLRTVNTRQSPTVNSVIVSRSLGEDEWRDWDWESQLATATASYRKFLSSQKKNGVVNGCTPTTPTSTSAKDRGSATDLLAENGEGAMEYFPNHTNLEMIVKALQEENRQLKEAKLCKVCMDDEARSSRSHHVYVGQPEYRDGRLHDPRRLGQSGQRLRRTREGGQAEEDPAVAAERAAALVRRAVAEESRRPHRRRRCRTRRRTRRRHAQGGRPAGHVRQRPLESGVHEAGRDGGERLLLLRQRRRGALRLLPRGDRPLGGGGRPGRGPRALVAAVRAAAAAAERQRAAAARPRRVRLARRRAAGRAARRRRGRCGCRSDDRACRARAPGLRLRVGAPPLLRRVAAFAHAEAGPAGGRRLLLHRPGRQDRLLLLRRRPQGLGERRRPLGAARQVVRSLRLRPPQQGRRLRAQGQPDTRRPRAGIPRRPRPPRRGDGETRVRRTLAQNRQRTDRRRR